MADKNNDFLDFNLPQDAYAAFDAVSLKDFIVNRLNENEQFTDQNLLLRQILHGLVELSLRCRHRPTGLPVV